MIGFDVKKCIMKASLQRLYWNVWVSWSFGQDWRLKIWIYLRTKKLLISLFASPSSYTYLLHRKKTKPVIWNSCYTYCCLRHKKRGLVKLYNNIYTFTMSTEDFMHSKTCRHWHLHIKFCTDVLCQCNCEFKLKQTSFTVLSYAIYSDLFVNMFFIKFHLFVNKKHSRIFPIWKSKYLLYSLTYH